MDCEFKKNVRSRRFVTDATIGYADCKSAKAEIIYLIGLVLLILTFVLFPINIYAQSLFPVKSSDSRYNCTSFFKSANTNYRMSLKEDRVSLYRFHKDDYGQYWEDTIEELYDCHYHISNDTLTLCDCDFLFTDVIKHDPQSYYFKIIEDGILISLSNLSNICKKGDKFYCSRYEYKPPESLRGGKDSWKNGKKNGVWLYVDPLWNIYNLIYKDDVVIEKILIQKSSKSNKLPMVIP